MNITNVVCLLITILCLLLCSISSYSQDFDFFYFVSQWPPALCDSRQSCCFPTTGQPAQDFTIHGLWPNYNSGRYPSNCRPDDVLRRSEISNLIGKLEIDWPTLACPSGDGTKFWDHEWGKHGTCTSLDQHAYFQTALDLKHKASLLHLLKNKGIRPGDSYSLSDVKRVIEEGIGYEPFVDCNVDLEGNHQLYQIYLCVDASASNFIRCPVFPHGRACGPTIQFQAFDSNGSVQTF